MINIICSRNWKIPILHTKQGNSEGFDSCDRPSYLKLDSNHIFFSQCDLEIWWMISKNNRALLLYYVKLCASFQIHLWIQTGVTFDRRPRKTTGHLFYTTSSFLHNFKSIGEVKLELQSGNAQFGAKLVIFFVPRNLEIWWMTLKNNRHLFYTTLSFVHHFKAMGEFKLELQSGNAQFWSKSAFFFVPCDFKIWRMTLKNNRALLLSR